MTFINSTIGIITIAIFVLLAVMVVIKSISLPEEYFRRLSERNEIRKRVIKSQMPIEEEKPEE